MSPARRGVSPSGRQVARHLRELRERAGISTTQIAPAIGLSQSSVSRIENAKQPISRPEVERWLDAVRASRDERNELLELLESASVAITNWRRSTRRGWTRLQRDAGELERASTAIRVYTPVLLSGLLQTAEVARVVFEQLHLWRSDISEAVAARLERQSILLDRHKTFDFVLAEAALRWRISGAPPEALVRQVARIRDVAGLPNVRVGIIPQEAEAPVWPAHAFHIYEIPEAAVVTVETMTEGVDVTDPAEVASYRVAFQRLSLAASYGDKADELLTAAENDLGLPAYPSNRL